MLTRSFVSQTHTKVGRRRRQRFGNFGRRRRHVESTNFATTGPQPGPVALVALSTALAVSSGHPERRQRERVSREASDVAFGSVLDESQLFPWTFFPLVVVFETEARRRRRRRRSRRRIRIRFRRRRRQFEATQERRRYHQSQVALARWWCRAAGGPWRRTHLEGRPRRVPQDATSPNLDDQGRPRALPAPAQARTEEQRGHLGFGQVGRRLGQRQPRPQTRLVNLSLSFVLFS